MFRVKIGLTATALVILVNVLVYIGVVFPMEEAATSRITGSVERASQLVQRVQTLNGYDLVNLALSIADRKEFLSWTNIEDEEKRRIAVFDAVDQLDKELKKEGRKPHFLGVLGPDGAVIARDLDIKNMYGEKLAFRNVNRATEGKASKDIWNWKNRMMRAATAPIWVNGQVEGVVAIGYDITSSEARQERDMYGTHVAYFMGNNIRGSSFSIKGGGDREDSSLVTALSQQLLGKPDSPGPAALKARKTSKVIELQIDGARYLSIAGPLPGHKDAGYVVLASLSDALAPVSKVRRYFLLLTLVSLLLVLGSMFVVARHFVNAEDKLELGVSEVINGNVEYTFEAVEEFEGLANAINVMLNRLLGRPEPGEELDESDAALDASVLLIDEADEEGDDEALEHRLAAEQEDAYYERICHEYVEARETMGLPIEGISAETLTQKLKANEALLKAKHKCGMVRFVVNAEDGKVTLKPIRIG